LRIAKVNTDDYRQRTRAPAMIFAEPIWRLDPAQRRQPGRRSPPSFSASLIIGVFLVYFRYVFGYFMRNFERQADAYVFTLFDSAAPADRHLSKNRLDQRPVRRTAPTGTTSASASASIS
ncbi:MAG: hypothetical protein MZV70_29100, partial [Desulfobacterales bacterium]|nr:hypothetical protein [Desulfobacterales bacterium]